MIELHLHTAEPRPDFRLVITFLWGEDHDVDCDGDAQHPASRSWTDLYCADRADPSAAFEVEVFTGPSKTVVRSERDVLGYRVALFLSEETRAEVCCARDGAVIQRSTLVSACGNFDVDAAFERTRNSRWRRATATNPYPE